VQYLDRTSHLLDDLPPARYDLRNLAQSPVPTNLPYCYYLADKIHERIVPSIVLEEAIENWDKSLGFPKVIPPPGWSSEWRSNRSIQNWVLPFPRWRTLAVDKRFHNVETWNRVLRAMIGTHEDIVPIMFSERKHDFVIFRIAERIYFFNRGRYGPDDDHRIWALPCSMQDLSNPALLAAVERQRWYSGPLCGRVYDCAESALLHITEGYLLLLDFLDTDDGRLELVRRSLADDPRSWSPKDREDIQFNIKQRWRKSHRPMNDRPKKEDDDY